MPIRWFRGINYGQKRQASVAVAGFAGMSSSADVAVLLPRPWPADAWGCLPCTLPADSCANLLELPPARALASQLAVGRLLSCWAKHSPERWHPEISLFKLVCLWAGIAMLVQKAAGGEAGNTTGDRETEEENDDEDEDENEDKEERVFLGKLTQWTSQTSGEGSQLTILNGGTCLWPVSQDHPIWHPSTRALWADFLLSPHDCPQGDTPQGVFAGSAFPLTWAWTELLVQPVTSMWDLPTFWYLGGAVSGSVLLPGWLSCLPAQMTDLCKSLA